MALLIQKFGGTSVGSTDRIERVAELIIRTVQAGHKVVAVVSAMAGETNRLLGLAQQIDVKASTRELDVLAATGEQVTVALLAMALIKRGFPAVSLLADQICIHTDNKFGKARITSVDTVRLQQELEQGHIVVAAGFQGRDFEGNVTTLGRGGSDTSAVALAAALKADECQIYTDVDGVYTIDPRLCSQAQRLNLIPFTDMLELASLGAKVLHSRSVEYAGLFKVPLRVLSTFKPDAGTLIVYEDNGMLLPKISGIASQTGISLLQLTHLPLQQMQQVIAVLAEQNIEIDMLQYHGDWPLQLTLSFTVASSDSSQVVDAIKKLTENSTVSLHHPQQNLAKLSVVGIGIKSDPMLVDKIFSAFNEMNVQLYLVTHSESRFSALIAAEQLEKVASKLHQLLVTADI